MLDDGVSPQTSVLPSLQVSNLREQALQALREAIVMGGIAPGTHLAEVRLASELGISRGTLREALRQLQQEGLAVTDGRGRLHVRSLDARTIAGTFRVRAALEALAARTVADMPEEPRAKALRQLDRALRTMRDAEEDDLPMLERLEADVEFHRTLCRVSDNEVLLQTWEQLAGVLRMSIMHAGAQQAKLNTSADKHQEVIDVIADGPADLEARITAHILAVLGDFGVEG